MSSDLEMRIAALEDHARSVGKAIDFLARERVVSSMMVGVLWHGLVSTGKLREADLLGMVDRLLAQFQANGLPDFEAFAADIRTRVDGAIGEIASLDVPLGRPN